MKSKRFALATAALLTGMISGCAPQIVEVPIQVPLEVPAARPYPRISAEELKCLSDETFYKIATRDRMKREDIEVLRAIIESTHK